eukprot:12053_1
MDTGIRAVKPNYKQVIPHDEDLIENNQFMALFEDTESKVLSVVNLMRNKLVCIDKCSMIIGLCIFGCVSMIAFLFMLPMMIWIVFAASCMFGGAIFTLCLRQVCPSFIYNILIDAFHIPHNKR